MVELCSPVTSTCCCILSPWIATATRLPPMQSYYYALVTASLAKKNNNAPEVTHASRMRCRWHHGGDQISCSGASMMTMQILRADTEINISQRSCRRTLYRLIHRECALQASDGHLLYFFKFNFN